MNRCDECFYNGNVTLHACHICNNEKDMYRPRKITLHEKICSLSIERFAKFLVDTQINVLRETVEDLREVYGDDFCKEFDEKVEEKYEAMIQEKLDLLKKKVDR